MTLMIQLANTLVIDLGLNPRSAIRSAHNLAESGNKAYPQDEAPMKQPTLEECRAFLGLKYMTSVFVTIPAKRLVLADMSISISTYVKYQDDLSCASGYVEKCLQFLQDNDEYPSDALLTQLVRLQNIAQEINEALPRYEDDFSSGPTAPISMCIRTLQSKLESFRTKLPLHLQQNRKYSSLRLEILHLIGSSFPSNALPQHASLPYRNCAGHSTFLTTCNPTSLSNFHTSIPLIYVLCTTRGLL